MEFVALDYAASGAGFAAAVDGTKGKASWEYTSGWIGTSKMIFLCVPLRTCVFVHGLCCAIVGLIMLHWRYMIEKDRRPFVGGYGEISRVLIDVLETSALLWGSLGMLGALYLRASWVRAFYNYQFVRFMVWGLMYGIDMRLLLNCELGRDDPHEFVHRFGPNRAMLGIAAAGTCDEERSLFYFLSPLMLLLQLKLLFACRQLLGEIEDEPRFLLNVPKDTPSGAFWSKAHGTRSEAAQFGFPTEGGPDAVEGYGSHVPLMAAPHGPGPAPSFGSQPMALQKDRKSVV